MSRFFSSCIKWGLLSSWGVQASHCKWPLCQGALGHSDFSTCGPLAQSAGSMSCSLQTSFLRPGDLHLDQPFVSLALAGDSSLSHQGSPQRVQRFLPHQNAYQPFFICCPQLAKKQTTMTLVLAMRLLDSIKCVLLSNLSGRTIKDSFCMWDAALCHNIVSRSPDH